MAPRQNLQTLLEEILDSDQVHFQPPPKTRMAYPCIVYQRDDIQSRHADNRPYTSTLRYRLTFISQDPDDETLAKIAALPMTAYDRFYPANGLNHDVFILYY